jgi:hypothetical protein
VHIADCMVPSSGVLWLGEGAVVLLWVGVHAHVCV